MPQTEQTQVNYKNFKRNPNQNAHSATSNKKKVPLRKTNQYYTVKYFMLIVTECPETCYWKITGNKKKKPFHSYLEKGSMNM